MASALATRQKAPVVCATFSEAAERALWEREYRDLQIIPSTTRTLPSKALLMAVPLLELGGAARVLDLGCGNGRNAVYLARRGCRVHAVDFAESALAELRELAAEAGVTDRVHPYNCSLAQPLPFAADSFSLVIDSYVFCHFLDPDLKDRYLNELAE